MESAKKFISGEQVRDVANRLAKEALQDADVQAFLKENQEKITQEIVNKSISKIYEFVQEKKKIERQEATRMGEDFYPRLVLAHNFIEVEYVPTNEAIERNQARAIASRIQSFDIPLSVRNAKLSEVYPNETRSEALVALTDFIDAYYNNRQEFHKGLYLYGNFGVGKSYLLGAVANEFAKKGTNVVMVHFPTFIVEMKRSISDNSYYQKLQVLKDAEILILDDIGAESNTEWTRDDILSVLLQYRMQENLSTFFTSNQSYKELEEHLSQTKNSEALLKAQRIMERVKYLAHEVKMSGENLR